MMEPSDYFFESWNVFGESRHLADTYNWNPLTLDNDQLDDLFDFPRLEMAELEEDWRVQGIEQRSCMIKDDLMWGCDDLKPDDILVPLELVTPPRLDISTLEPKPSPTTRSASTRSASTRAASTRAASTRSASTRPASTRSASTRSASTRSKSTRSKSSRPSTPPSMDSEDHPQFRHAVDVAGTALRLLSVSASVAADHSYTLARQHIDSLGVQTPSDTGESEEEIDVVSIETTKQLMDAATQMRPEPVRQRPAVQQRYRNQRNKQLAEAAAAARPTVGRKRLVPPSDNPTASVPRKRRGPGRRARANMDIDSDPECPETERRSIHNTMERQRRIGLKNLFDGLKDEVPATKDRERVAKVVVLREAAAYCLKLRQDDVLKERLMKKQNKLRVQLRHLRQLHSQQYQH